MAAPFLIADRFLIFYCGLLGALPFFFLFLLEGRPPLCLTFFFPGPFFLSLFFNFSTSFDGLLPAARPAVDGPAAISFEQKGIPL